MSDSLRPHNCSLPGSSGRKISRNYLGKNIGGGSHSLLQGTFPTQELNLGLPHCRQILYHLSHQGSTVKCLRPATSLCHKKKKARERIKWGALEIQVARKSTWPGHGTYSHVPHQTGIFSSDQQTTDQVRVISHVSTELLMH